jgi:hypothetical protein
MQSSMSEKDIPFIENIITDELSQDSTIEEVSQLNLRITDRIWSDSLIAAEYLGTIILHSEQGIQDMPLVL